MRGLDPDSVTPENMLPLQARADELEASLKHEVLLPPTPKRSAQNHQVPSLSRLWSANGLWLRQRMKVLRRKFVLLKMR